MSTLSSGRGLIWASKSGAGLRDRACFRVFLLDRTEVRREVTQENTVGQDAQLRGTQRGELSELWLMEERELTRVYENMSGRWVGDVTKWRRSAKYGHLYKDVYLQVFQSSWDPGLRAPQTVLLDAVITLSLWWNPALHSILSVASLLATGDTRE